MDKLCTGETLKQTGKRTNWFGQEAEQRLHTRRPGTFDPERRGRRLHETVSKGSCNKPWSGIGARGFKSPELSRAKMTFRRLSDLQPRSMRPLHYTFLHGDKSRGSKIQTVGLFLVNDNGGRFSLLAEERTRAGKILKEALDFASIVGSFPHPLNTLFFP